jgi:hypothetical protein
LAEEVLALCMLEQRELSIGLLCRRGQVVTACEKCHLLNREYSFVTLLIDVMVYMSGNVNRITDIGVPKIPLVTFFA